MGDDNPHSSRAVPDDFHCRPFSLFAVRNGEHLIEHRGIHVAPASRSKKLASLDWSGNIIPLSDVKCLMSLSDEEKMLFESAIVYASGDVADITMACALLKVLDVVAVLLPLPTPSDDSVLITNTLCAIPVLYALDNIHSSFFNIFLNVELSQVLIVPFRL